MEGLEFWSSVAEIFGGLAIVGGAVFGVIQVSEFRRNRKYQAAVDLCQRFSEPELAKAVNLLRSLPDGLGLEELRARGPEYEQACQIVAMPFETVGLLVYMDVASFKVVQQLTGGLLLMIWRKFGRWVLETREEQKHARFAEWVQWLTERMQEVESDVTPAYLEHKDWLPRR